MLRCDMFENVCLNDWDPYLVFFVFITAALMVVISEQAGCVPSYHLQVLFRGPSHLCGTY